MIEQVGGLFNEFRIVAGRCRKRRFQAFLADFLGNPLDAGIEQLRRIAIIIIVLLGIITWLICLPRIATLGSLLQYLGAFVASTIWPIAAGLYLKKANATGAFLAMLVGTLSGIWAFFSIGF